MHGIISWLILHQEVVDQKIKLISFGEDYDGKPYSLVFVTMLFCEVFIEIVDN
jgi:hypothetical protein